MNKKGFTVVELLASFTLTMIIVVFLFEIVLELKDVYTTNQLKTRILNQNALVATKLTKSLSNLTIHDIDVNSAVDNEQGSWLDDGDAGFDIETESGDDTHGDCIVFDARSENKEKICMPVGTDIADVDFKISPDPELPSTDNKINSYLKISYNVVSENSFDETIPFNYVYAFHAERS